MTGTVGEGVGVRPFRIDVPEEDLVPGQLAGGAAGPVQGRDDRRSWLAVGIVMVEQPGGQADG